MVKYICEKCGKEFKQKSHYNTHMNKKNPCVTESKIKEMIDNALKAKIVETISQNTNNSNIYIKNVNYHKIKIPKPILKWVGGKTQIIDKLIVEFPTEINNYREIFLGGGSVLLTLLSYVKSGVIKVHGNIYAHDLNEPLIYIYKNIQTNHNQLYDKLQEIIREFNKCGDGEINREPKNIDEAKISKENYYYWTRIEYNKLSFNDKKTILGSAMFIFLNKTCFRGVFRVGPKGFNVPYGHNKNPEIINKEHLDEIHDLIQGVIFECCDYNTSLASIEDNDYVYLDPPYAPETEISFVGYTENGFSLDNHNNLFKLIHKLTETNKKMMLSNADVSLVRENFTDQRYNITSILCKRAINAKNPNAKAKEVIIKNY
jgi:DNA adenine methylase